MLDVGSYKPVLELPSANVSLLKMEAGKATDAD